MLLIGGVTEGNKGLSDCYPFLIQGKSYWLNELMGNKKGVRMFKISITDF